MRQLYAQIYLTVVGILALFCVLAGAVWMALHDPTEERRMLSGIAAVAAKLLPDAARPATELQTALERLDSDFELDVAVHTPDGRVLASVGAPLPAPTGANADDGRLRMRGPGAMVTLRLADGRRLVARHRHTHHPGAWLLTFGMLGVAVAIGAYPVVRRLTRRLERLQVRVDALAGGDLAARVHIEGRDEVAQLARSFNQAAERIERLLNAQRTLLASVSHETRTPLARLRMAFELLTGHERPDLRDQIATDIAQLDELIEEILLASRLDTAAQISQPELVDLLALLAEEGARAGVQVAGKPATVRGDARLLRRLMRNLLDNARRYADAPTIEASVTTLAGGVARLCVADRGPGVPAEEHERVFEPFYRLPGPHPRGDAGVGLGLALVRQIARHHGGDARCLARDGGGTIFEVDLPGA